MQARGFSLEEEALTPTGQFHAWSSAAGQPDHNPSRNSSERAFVGTAEGFRRPVRVARDISGAFPQMVNAPYTPVALHCCHMLLLIPVDQPEFSLLLRICPLEDV